MANEVRQFDWDQARLVSRRNLPHLEQDGAIAFVTFRLADSLPWQKVRQWKNEREQWLAANPPPHTSQQQAILRQLLPKRLHDFLDAGHGQGVLAKAEAQDILESVLRFGDGAGYRLGEFVIMPNHVHVLVQPTAQTLHKIVAAWKSISSRRINKVLGRRGQLWQEESFDHLLRDGHKLKMARRYIDGNPSRLAAGSYRLGCGSLQ